MDDWTSVLAIVSDLVRVLTFALRVGTFSSKKKRPDSE